MSISTIKNTIFYINRGNLNLKFPEKLYLEPPLNMLYKNILALLIPIIKYILIINNLLSLPCLVSMLGFQYMGASFPFDLSRVVFRDQVGGGGNIGVGGGRKTHTTSYAHPPPDFFDFLPPPKIKDMSKLLRRQFSLFSPFFSFSFIDYSFSPFCVSFFSSF